MGKRPIDNIGVRSKVRTPKHVEEHALIIVGPKPQRGELIKDDTGPRLGWGEVKWGYQPKGES